MQTLSICKKNRNFANEKQFQPPMHLNTIKKIAKASMTFVISVAAMTISSAQVHAQDLIARQAPVDRKMKTVDSLIINKAIRRQHARVAEINYESNDLYSTWNTKTVHCYGSQTKPEHYRIDLRGFAMPTPSRVVTSNFGYRPSFGRMHKGLDVKVYIGDTIASAFDGKVRIVNYEAKGYGNYVVIRHNNGLETIYGHLSKHLCKVGDIVKAGQPIGLGGNTGRSTGSHLHFETRILGEAINPALLFDFVHQDVTCDFYDYRSNGQSEAAPRVQTASVAATKPASKTTSNHEGNKPNPKNSNTSSARSESKEHNQSHSSSSNNSSKSSKNTKSKSASHHHSSSKHEKSSKKSSSSHSKKS